MPQRVEDLLNLPRNLKKRKSKRLQNQHQLKKNPRSKLRAVLTSKKRTQKALQRLQLQHLRNLTSSIRPLQHRAKRTKSLK